MLDKEKIIKDFEKEIEQTETQKDLGNVKVKYLGKSGLITGYLKSLKDIAKEEKPVFGKLINEIKNHIEAKISYLEAAFSKKELESKLRDEQIDITIPSSGDGVGSIHPIRQVIREIEDVFIGMGFEIKEGPEIETDYYCFQALNLPKDHPAREMQDTFYINENVVLRPHTSPVQIRTLEKETLPIRILAHGRTYRADDDATHSPMFHQVEGLVVDEKITLCDLKGVLEVFAKKMFGQTSKVRFRPSYFPFTEPSVEVDVSCAMCGGKGCKLCKGTGWLEILGAGIVNPVVLENAGVDSKKYSGFAFGVGIERTAMLKYGIPDIKILFENDIRFLKNYK